MNQVFITRPVGGEAPSAHRAFRDLKHIAALIAGGALGGVSIASGLSAIGRLARAVDPTPRGIIVLVSALTLGLVSLALQAESRVQPLPERKRQVPRRWLGWKNRSVTAFMFGFLLGGGAFTHLRYAAMYTLALLVLIAPDVTTGALIGGLYGANRTGTALYSWIVNQLGLSVNVGLGRKTPAILVLAGVVLPMWSLAQLLA